MAFPTLYKQNAAGKTMNWCLSVEGNTIYRHDGHTTGKQKSSERVIEANTLRSADQQALLEGEKMWLLQLDKGYKPAENDVSGQKVYAHVLQQKQRNGGMNRGVKMFGASEISEETTSGTISQTFSPMLAQKYLDQKDKVKFPAYVQPKVDGIRAIAYMEDGKVVLQSRNGKGFMWMDHLRQEIKSMNLGDLKLDGEVYVHSLTKNHKELDGMERFQFISEGCKITRKVPHEEELKLEYWIFDLYDLQKSFEERWKILSSLSLPPHIKLVPTYPVKNHQDIETYYQKFRQADFEGLMVRNNKKYISRDKYHCPDLLKYKEFLDDEWNVVGAEACQGNQLGAVKWILEKDQKRVVAKQEGNLETSKRLYQAFTTSPQKYLGKAINIRYFCISKEGIPRFPIAVSFVEDK